MNYKTLGIILFCFFIPIFLLLTSYKLTLFLTDTTTAQEQTILFLEGKNTLPLEYTSQERSHLKDVQQVMRWANGVFYVLLCAITAFIVIWKKIQKKIWKTDQEMLQKLLWHGGLTTVISLGLLSGLIVLFFNQVFTLFHLLFFPQGNWTFPADSHLIQTFPLEFFYSISLDIFLLSLVLGIILMITARKIQTIQRSP